MKPWSNLFFHRRSVSIAVLLVILTAGVYAAFRGNAARSSAEPESAAQGRSDQDLEAEVITILPSGFEPRELSRPAGRFVLMFDNESGLQSLELRLERTGMPRIIELRPNRKTEATQLLNLPAGEYQVTEANHPEWTMNLTITKR